MTIKRSLYTMVMMVAVVSMIVPSVLADVRRPKPYVYDRAFKNENRARLLQHQANPKANPKKALPNNGLLLAGEAPLERGPGPDEAVPRVEDLMILPGAGSKLDAGMIDRIRSTAPVTLTPEMRERLQLRAPGAETETAASRKARLEQRFAAAERGLVRGTSSTADVLPAAEIADGSSLSAIGFVGISGTEDFFDEAVLLGDLDGNRLLENDFATTNAPRTFIDRQAKVEDDVLLPDEVYTALAVSGHNAANGFNAPTDFNVFYTATSAGFLNVLGDTVCDGNLEADTVISVVALTNIVIPGTGGRTFSNSASITGLAVNTDSEYDGDMASDELVWFSVFDPEFGGEPTGTPTSALLQMRDSDGDDIPDAGDIRFLATSNRVSVAGVAVDSYGDVYWHLTDFGIGLIVKAWDTNENRIPDVGFTNFNAITNLDLFNAANAVSIATDRYNTVYLQVSGGIGAPVATGLPSHVASYIDRCGDFDPITGLIPRQNQVADDAFRIFAADAEAAQPAGAGEAPATLVLPGMQIDYAGGYRGLAADWDDNIYVAYGAVPADQAGNPSPFFGGILRIPDNNCDRVGDAVDMDGDRVFGGGDGLDDYMWMESPLNPPELTPNGINFISFGPLFSLERGGLGLGDDDEIKFTFDDFDGPANNVAGGACDLLLATACDNVGQNLAGGPSGFEWLFCNTAWTGFLLLSNGRVIISDLLGPDQETALGNDFSPTVVEFLSGPPQVAPAWTDLTYDGGGQFSLTHLGFAATDAFIIQAINVPQFGLGGVGVGVDTFGFPKRGNTNSFDVTFYDDQDTWDDVDAEIVGDETNLDDTVNNDDDGTCFPAGISLRPEDPTRIFDRNGDGDITDENLLSFSQEGVGRVLPEQGPFKLVYHQMEIVGSASQPVIVGFSTGFDGVFNVGTIPPGLCETNLSAATPAADDPFFMGGEIGMGTEPSLYEFFNQGTYGSVNPDGTINPVLVDFDLRQEVPADCIARPERFIDTTSADCLLFKGSNIPVGLFCQSIDISDDPFLGDATLTLNGFRFPMPTSGENAVCPQFCGQTAGLCRAGKSVTYDVIFKFDEDGDGVVDATIPFAEPDVVVTSENQIDLTINFGQTTLCGGDAEVCVIATIGFGDDNKYFELQQLDGDAALEVAPVQLTCASTIDIGARAPVVLAIAPDIVDCDDPDDPDNVEDVIISGLCFFGNITSAYVTLSPDDSDAGGRIALMNVINIGPNQVTATVPLAQLTARDQPYYVFVVRGDGVRSTTYPNVFGFDVTFTCASNPVDDRVVTLTSCRVVRTATGRFVLQVNGVNFTPNDTIVLLNGQPCRRNRYPSRFINPSDGTTTRINCSGGLNGLLPAVVTTRDQSTGLMSENSLNCDRRR